MAGKIDPSNKEKALDALLQQTKKKFGADNVLTKLGSMPVENVEAFSTGSFSIDRASGVWGLPRGRIIEIYGPESSGKCLTADALITTPHGLLTIEELFAEMNLDMDTQERVTDVRDLGVTIINEKGEEEKISAATHNGIKAAKRIVLDDGRSIEVTANHPLRTLNNKGEKVWTEAAEIAAGDVVISLGASGLPTGESTMTSASAFQLGELVAYHNAQDRQAFRSIVAINASIGALLNENADNASLTNEIEVIADALRRSDYAEVEVPRSVRCGDKGIQWSFLSGLFDDILWDDKPVAVNVAHKPFATQLQVILLGFGILSRVVENEGNWMLFCDPRTRISNTTEIGSKVVEVVDAGEKPTFDIMVEETHSFIANGIINHNTTLTLHAIADAQAKGGTAMFIDAEHALDPEYAANLGVDVDNLLFSQPNDGEEAMEIADMGVRSGAVDIIVIDSVAALVPKAELKGEMGDSHVGLQARLMSQGLRKLTGAVSQNNCTVIFINQLREKVGVFFGSPETTSGGKALKFYASMRIDVRRTGSNKDSKGEAISNTTKVKFVKNKVAPPFKVGNTQIFYGTGFSRESDLVEIGVETGIIKKSGSWFSYNNKQLGQGSTGAETALRNDPELARTIEEEIKEFDRKLKEEAAAKRPSKRRLAVEEEEEAPEEE